MLWFGALLVVLGGVCQGISTIYGIPIEDREQFRDKTSKVSSAIEAMNTWKPKIVILMVLPGLVGLFFIQCLSG